MSSGVMTEIREYLKSAEEIPFAQLIPHFPVVREQRMIPSFLQMVEILTLTFTHPCGNERVSDPRTDKIELARQHRKAERSLSSLQQRLMCNGSAVTLTCEPDNVKNLLEVDDIKNPYIAKPLKAGEKVASPVGLPAKLSGEAHTGKHVLLLEAFAPAIAAMKDGMCDSVSDGEKTLPEKRPGVRLEFKGGKKVFGDSLDLRIQNKDSGRIAAWFGREDEKDDKKSSLYSGNLWKTKKSSLSCKFLVS
ncbi:Transcription initiation factor TFIID subunit 8 [Forsythia ovata]|uniref:Transcription initiation factor TFIID subunit 8 n=1 Tax=Forsythia ovata TaxID=205694 RepID=A0ABD1T9F8_9LAMI